MDLLLLITLLFYHKLSRRLNAVRGKMLQHLQHKQRNKVKEYHFLRINTLFRAEKITA